MQEEILQLYEKIKDQLSEEEFNAEIEELRKSYGDVEFMNDVDLARMILGNYGVEDPEVISTDDEENAIIEATNDNSIESVEDTEFTMTEELQEYYDKVKDKITEEEFFKRMNEFKNENEGISFMGDATFADMVVKEVEDKEEEVEVISERPEYAADSIDKLEDGSKDVNVAGRVISISNKRSFKTRKGKKGKFAMLNFKIILEK